MNPPSLIESFQTLLDAFLFHPSNPTEFWVTLGVGLLVMLVVIFQTQSYFGAGQIFLQTAFMSLAVGLGIMIFGAVAIQCYVMPLIPADTLSAIQEKLPSSWNKDMIEYVIMGSVALVLLFAAASPLTAGFCRSNQFASAWSWVFALIAGIATFFFVHTGFVHKKQTTKSLDAVQQSEEKQKKSLLDGENQ